jgi:hypothetical protein
MLRIQIWIQDNFLTKRYVYKKPKTNKLYFIAFLFLIVVINSSILLSYRSDSFYRAESLNREMNSIKIGVKYLNKLEGNQLNIIVNQPWHYEYLYSIAAFSRFYANSETNIFSTIQINLNNLETEFQRKLALEMINDSSNGNFQNRNTLNPLIAQKYNKPIICITMPGVILPNFCTIDVPINVFNRTW